jgi:hypothetical protein
MRDHRKIIIFTGDVSDFDLLDDKRKVEFPVDELRTNYRTFRPPDLIDFSMTPNRRLSAVRCQETEFRWC